VASSCISSPPDDKFKRRFDAGEDISEFIDWKNARRPGRQLQRVNVDFPSWMVSAMDKESSRLGVSRQALIKFVMDKPFAKYPGSTWVGESFSPRQARKVGKIANARHGGGHGGREVSSNRSGVAMKAPR
jgi:hypothetical protein